MARSSLQYTDLEVVLIISIYTFVVQGRPGRNGQTGNNGEDGSPVNC